VPRFHYRALRPSGAEVAGELLAADERDAASRLQAAGSFPIEIAGPAGRPGLAALFTARISWRSGRIAGRDLVLFTRQLAALVGAGVALDRALGLIGGAGGRSAGRRLAIELLAAVNRGEGLAPACAGQAGLPRHYAMMIAAGEARGNLAAALERLAEVLERSRATARALLDALVYPASVLVVAFASIGFLLGFVVPRFAMLLTGLQREPPLAMQFLLALAALFQQVALPALVVGLLLLGGLLLRWRDPGFRRALQRRLLRLPLLGGLIGKLEAERLLYLLGSLVAAGVPLPAALAAARAAATGEAMRGAIATIEQGVERGDGIGASFAASGILPQIASELVRIGEETGDLAAMMLKAGDILQREFEATSNALIGLVTPVSIILLGLLIGAVAFAILGTVMQVYDLAA
jgi:general secretion pathway protein F